MIGGAAIDATGVPLPDDALESAKSSDAVLLGAVGGPKWGTGTVRPEQGLLKIRKELNLYANIRPCNFASDSLLELSPLKAEVVKGTNLIIVRELVGGIYFGERQEQEESEDKKQLGIQKSILLTKLLVSLVWQHLWLCSTIHHCQYGLWTKLMFWHRRDCGERPLIK